MILNTNPHLHKLKSKSSKLKSNSNQSQQIPINFNQTQINFHNSRFFSPSPISTKPIDNKLIKLATCVPFLEPGDLRYGIVFKIRWVHDRTIPYLRERERERELVYCRGRFFARSHVSPTGSVTLLNPDLF